MKIDKKIKDYLAIMLIILSSIMGGYFINSIPFIKGLESSLINERFQNKNFLEPARRIQMGAYKEGDKVDSDIIILGIDEISVSNDFLGPFPWSRDVYADFLRYFREDDRKYLPAYIFFDIFFDYYRVPLADDKFINEFSEFLYQKNPWSKTKNIQDFKQLVEEMYKKDYRTSDNILFDELKNHNNVFFDYLSQYTEQERFSKDELIPRLKYLLKDSLKPKNPKEFEGPVILDVKPPVEEISRQALGLGSALVETDPDGNVRKMPLLFLYYDDRVLKEPVFLPTIDLTLIMRYLDVKPEDLEIVFGKYIKVNNAKVPIKKKNKEGIYETIATKTQDIYIPIDKEGKMFINYQGISGSFENISFAFVNADTERQNAYLYKNRTLLIGFYSTAGLGKTKDYFNTPYGNMYGIEIHANAIYTILSNQFIKETGDTFNIILTVIIIAVLTFVLAKQDIIKGLITGFFGLLLVFMFGVFIFSGSIIALPLFIILLAIGILLFIIDTKKAKYISLASVALVFIIYIFLPSSITASFSKIRVMNSPLYIMNMTFPLSSILITMILNISYKVLTEEKEKKWIKGIFGSYVNPEVVNEIIKDPSKLELGGETRVLTVMFSDIRGFTTLSESLTPQELVLYLNKYLSKMTNILLANKGTLDKYIGDAIMAFWGAPIYYEDHAYLACKTALEMMDEVYRLNNSGELPPNIKIDIGLGINSGEMTVGNMGSEIRKNYTVMGDNVNLASRLEGTNKVYHTNIIVSENTYELVKDRFVFRELDLIRVKGKLKPVKIYELLGFKEELDKLKA
ncbi:MAG TPA: adenylate/guanylate cyclase domain-containing protein [Spirochaetota bacterium]|nr:adenylate/guanylate cyclase domain-containing protein [Spirochaetota bacterium]HOM38662.1 adenylate/guanylate cyclase domain-containing protein [Spirochaetota bacterium]HPQ49822.1 adenylate/guanylate cyclase domain-containing protein [Spirochaetota bacterium]